MTEPFPVAASNSESITTEKIEPVLGPVAAQERMFSVDALRGLAVLGILLMNIPHFGLPEGAGSNPTLLGEARNLNIISWFVSFVLFEGKMRALFSMLFGAGVVILTSRAEQRGGGGGIADIYYRRTIWLIIFGLLHAYFLWDGDILFWYGTFGLLLYPFRKLSGVTLVIIGVFLLSISIPKAWYFHNEMQTMHADAESAEEALSMGHLPTEEENAALKSWTARQNRKERQQEQMHKSIKLHQSDYWTIFIKRAKDNFRFHPISIYQFGLDDVLCMMFIGMGLIKLGVITAARSVRFYVVLALFGYGIGIPLNSYFGYELIQNDYDRSESILFFLSAYNWSRLTVALGHAAALMLICKSARAWILRPLAAVGQMALTNYLMQSAICTTLFYGYGFGLYGKLELYQLVLVVMTIWLLQLIISPLCLLLFRFGPMEWLWRSLTYWKWQPFLNR